MARVQARLQVECWKEWRCVNCSRQYRYLFTQGRLGHGDTSEAAEVDAVEKCVKAMENRVDVCPCPNCGHCQPEMIGKVRFVWHGLALLAMLGWLVLAIMAGTGEMNRILGLVLIAVMAVLIPAAHALINSLFPNCWANSNKIRANTLMRNGRVWLSPDAAPEEPARVNPDRPSAAFFSLLALICLASISAGDVVRIWNDWPSNAAWTPEVVGPGNKAWIYLPRTIQSVQKYWSGTVSATLEPVDEPGKRIPTFATTRTTQWGGTIRVKPSGESTTSTLWVQIRVPDDVKLEGKAMRVHVTLRVSYPQMDQVRRGFVVVEEIVEETALLQLAPSQAGATFQAAFLTGLLVPLALVVLVQLYSLWVANRLQKVGRPTVTVSYPKLKGQEDPIPMAIRTKKAPKGDTAFRADDERPQT